MCIHMLNLNVKLKWKVNEILHVIKFYVSAHSD